ncbi:YhgE/Pip domain-containing protein [Demequina capsici]|uniref:YhgE/Pip domain-containing protein n=1 Tax=Demequina capsici TaxID=3075620 RepID=A0AA96FFN0_9MICO|nr:YhgE/Pip domain-containing protein [Demequina sp. PMTSA13]WNM28735.1 YhgE/Pip domain-containing protein [Demequina sp. PMTSA13]
MSILSPGTELKRFRAGVLPRVALGVLLFIPLIYGALYLWAFWAPTEHLDAMAVALVDEDQAVTLSDGTTLDAGAQVKQALLDSGDLGWVVTDAAAAASGVSDGTYYFSVTIPAGFSSAIASVEGSDPQAAPIEVHYNETNSFLATTLGRTAMLQVQEAVSDTTSAQTALTLIQGVETLSSGVSDAADGARSLDSGTEALSSGATDLADGLGQLSSGASRLASGTTALSSGTRSLLSGAQSVADGAGSVAVGASALADGTSTLADGANGLSSGVAQLDDAAARLASSLDRLATGTSGMDTSAAALATGAAQVSTGIGTIAQLATAYPTMTLADLEAALEQGGGSLAALAAGGAQVADGTAALAASTAYVDDEHPGLVTSIQLLAQGADQLSASMADANDGAAQVSVGADQAAAGAEQLATGAGQLSDGADQLAAGAASLADGSTTVESGAAALADAAAQAASGSTDLADGAQQVADGTGTLSAALSDGASAAPTIDSSQATAMAAAIANPVTLDQTTDNQTQGFGEGFAPFFIALATFVGALITWLILRPLPVRLLGTRASGLRAVLTGFVPAALLAVGQTLIMMAVLTLGIGVSPVHLVGMTLFVLLATLAFMALQQMFVILLGSAAGRVVSLVLLMLQLSSSSGTYPVETSPTFFQALHPYMPASYVVTGLRALLGGGIDARFWGALAYMVGLLVVSLAVSAIAAGRQKVWTIARLHPELTI